VWGATAAPNVPWGHPRTTNLWPNVNPQSTHARFDPRSQRIGALYAKALLGAAERAGQTESLLEELDSFVDDVLQRHPRLEAVLSSAVIVPGEKIALLDRVFAPQASRLFLNFLKVLARHERLGQLRTIRQIAHQMHDQLRGRVRVDVRTAIALDDSLQETLREALRGRVGGEPVLQCRTVPELLGGLVLQVGDTIFDASVATELERVRNQLMQRSVYEIQRRRDRLRLADGD
jgi:F-type H+-transporting ATPase subunit delta